MITLLSFLLFSLLFLVGFPSPVMPEPTGPVTETAALLRLKSSLSDPANALAAWSPSSSSLPCNSSTPWPGVQCYNGILIGLRLAGLNLSGTFDAAALSNLPALHSIDLSHNSLSGPLPTSLATLHALRALYLSHNAFSGPIPSVIFSSMHWLKKLYLDHNSFSDALPSSALATAPRLLELHLEHNQLEGSLPSSLPSSLKDFNVSYNRLSGQIPQAVGMRYNTSAFAGNSGLCGSPGSETLCAAPPAPLAAPPAAGKVGGGNHSNLLAVVGIVVLVFALVAVAIVLMRRRQEKEAPFDQLGKVGSNKSSAVVPVASPVVETVAVAVGSSHAGTNNRSRRRMSDLVVVNEEKGVFGLPELMKATAEVLGNGTLGSVYKAAMENGVMVAVKRMRDMNRVGKEEFEDEMRLLGALRHPNVLTPLAYHYQKEEKLIVSEYMPKGSLLYVLHGDQGSNRTTLDWPARLKIASGVTQGMAYLQAELGGSRGDNNTTETDTPPPPVHGNLKSGNILLDATLEPHLVDYGFFPLINPAQAPHAMSAFRSPEGTRHRVVSAKSDVFCLGVILLELVTGKFPSQYLLNARGGTDIVQWTAAAIAEKREGELLDPPITGSAKGAAEMAVRLLRVGAACTDVAPERRPDMVEVAELVEEIVVAAAAAAEEADES